MAKKPNVPCTGCGKLLWGGSTSLPAGQRMCRECRRSTHAPGPALQRCGKCKQDLALDAFAPSSQGRAGGWCRACFAVYHHAKNALASARQGTCTDCGQHTERRATAYGRFCEACAIARRRARDSRKVSLRRAVLRVTDITAEYERSLRRNARICPLCHTELTDDPRRPNSKQLDHIIPIVMGGTHTMANVRIICRTCNLTRPKDGSDLEGHQATLWAQVQGCARAATV